MLVVVATTASESMVTTMTITVLEVVTTTTNELVAAATIIEVSTIITTITDNKEDIMDLYEDEYRS